MDTKNTSPNLLVELIEDSIKRHWELTALSDMGGVNYKYKELAETIEKLHIMFESTGVKPGDKVAICGRNSSNWMVAFIACLTSGVVAVPILHEFKPDMIHHLVTHSDSKLLFTDAAIWENLDEKQLPGLDAVIFISEPGMPFSRNKKLTETRNNINELFGRKFPSAFTPRNVSYIHSANDDTAVINYTSGSTGMSKGVMLSYRNIWSNIRFCLDHIPFFKAGDGIVNMLPLAHLYGMVIETLHPVIRGCHCYFLTKLPSPKVILKAFADVKPKLIITVPLILEKIIRNKVFPQLEKPLMKFLLKIPVIDNHLLAKVKAGLMEAFGGNLQELIVGGAPLNPDVEKFLFQIEFPVTVGYGMTECSPLISYASTADSKPHTVGRIVDRMEIRVDSPDPAAVPGNIWVRGANVMKGYYKNEAATKEVMPDSSGWMNTGDLGMIADDGMITICGRSKTMILGPSGQNIYPEEIEAKLNNMPYVAESLIIDEGGKLAALVYPDMENTCKQGMSMEDIVKVMNENIEELNKDLPGYSKVSRVKIFEEEFEKTPKRSIKRFLYQP